MTRILQGMGISRKFFLAFVGLLMVWLLVLQSALGLIMD